MLGANVTAAAVPVVGPAPPQTVRGSVEPRAVEEAARTTAASNRQNGVAINSGDVVKLLRSSAQRFEKVLEITSQPTAAGAMSGFVTPCCNGHVDTYG